MIAIKDKILKVWSRIQGYLKGWHTSQKIIVFESDDWGCQRISSRKAYEHFSALGYEMNLSHYSMDALETDEDLELLYDVLNKVRDRRGRPACFTSNMVLANPDFHRIQQENFQNYYYVPVDVALEKIIERKQVNTLWHTGMDRRLFIPQFHAREHIRWWDWLAALREGSIEALEAFKYDMCGLPFAASREGTTYFSPQYLNSHVLKSRGVDQELMIREGIDLFERLFHYKSLSTVAPNVSWTNETEKIWSSCGIRYVQGGLIQYDDSLKKQRQNIHFLGEKSQNNLLYLTRNCYFEPSRYRHDNEWQSCLRSIACAFAWRRPAVISSHRVNYIGVIDQNNRIKGLAQLKQLLAAVLERWPDVYFLSSPELGYMIENKLTAAESLSGKDEQIYPLAAC